jgi:hypothetical protein
MQWELIFVSHFSREQCVDAGGAHALLLKDGLFIF